uniref:RNase H type-1 domain-containing protein n=1 Tax=Solanum lycopersicum TaxID=4081 RepID=A0A3Q7IX10_SOLLC
MPKQERRSGICYRSKALITYSLSHLLHSQFGKVRVGESWKSICHLCDASMTSKSVALVRWIKPPLLFVKLNSDGRCRDGICGGGGVVRDSMGALIMAYSIPLGAGTSNWAEAKAMLFGLKCCIERR